MHFSVLKTTCGRQPEPLECKFHALPCALFFSLHVWRIFFFLWWKMLTMIRNYIGSEVGDAATYSIKSDGVSRLMITMCRRKNCAPRYEVVYLFLLYNTYDCLISFIFGVLFTWFNWSFWVQLYILD